METVRIYLKGTPNKFISAKSEQEAEKAIAGAMKEFGLPRSYFYIMKGIELEEHRLYEEAYRLNKKAGLGLDLQKPRFSF